MLKIRLFPSFCVPNGKSAGHVARMGEGRGVHRVWWGNLREGDHWGDPDIDGRIILRWVLKKWEGFVGTG
jgi:hypothetical protein